MKRETICAEIQHCYLTELERCLLNYASLNDRMFLSNFMVNDECKFSRCLMMPVSFFRFKYFMPAHFRKSVCIVQSHNVNHTLMDFHVLSEDVFLWKHFQPSAHALRILSNVKYLFTFLEVHEYTKLAI